MSPHGPQPAPEPADQQAGAGQVRLATPPPAWGGPAAQYTQALPHIPLPSAGELPERQARHRQPDTGEVPVAETADVRPEAPVAETVVVPRMDPPPVYQPTRQVPVVDVDGLVAWFRGWPVRRISVGGLVATLAAILLVIGSFAPFVAYGGAFPNLLKLGAPVSYSAWSGRTFMFPLSALPVVLAIAVVAMVGVGMRPGSGSVPLPFGSRQLSVAAAGAAFLIMAGYAVSVKTVVFEPLVTAPAAAGVTLSFGGGGVTMLLASLAMLVGAVIHLAGIGPELAPSTE
ncbi:hypothetical protein [Fodinicola acaciae]|uniref:hypothetical protein n=1 Tax=Fodinicola acaciae TaxID=2681555 RepID=UPI0013D212DC|nr:hypothetical protein [Fodinicola acaciae]